MFGAGSAATGLVYYSLSTVSWKHSRMSLISLIGVLNMISFYRKEAALASCLLLSSPAGMAAAGHSDAGMDYGSEGFNLIQAGSHAPVGVMGDHMHKKGEWMFSYRYKYMEMKGSRIGTNRVSPETIVTTVANPFAAVTGQPATLRVVPTRMTMQMHMVGAMYAPSDRLTLMFMTLYHKKKMNHITFQGGIGTTRRGNFVTRARGPGDSRLSGLVRLFENDTHHIHISAGLNLPTGSNRKRDTVLAPDGTTPTLRLPYPMQLGSGTFDLLPGLTCTGRHDRFAWGTQYTGTIRTGTAGGYTLGDIHEFTGWLSYGWRPGLSTSVRLSWRDQGSIDGRDPQIVAPVQTADPANQGGRMATLFLGVNLAGQEGRVRGHRLAVEAGIPLHRDLNGPQLETDVSITGSWQYAF